MWWYAFLPSMLTTLIGILYVIYQFFAFKYSPLFENSEKSFLTEVISTVVGYLNRHGDLWIPTIIVAVVILISYALLPTLAQGAMIQTIARSKKGYNISIGQGISLGMLAFLPLLEYHLLIKSFSIVSLFTEAGFALRNLGAGWMETLLPVFIIATVVGFILMLLFTYSEFFIVLHKDNALSAMGRSAKLVILSWQHTFLIGILMLIIGLRVIINVIAVLIVPALLFFAAGFVASTTFTTIGISVGVFIGFVSLFVTSYFTGIFNVFANAVWTYTYLALIEEKLTKEVM